MASGSNDPWDDMSFTFWNPHRISLYQTELKTRLNQRSLRFRGLGLTLKENAQRIVRDMLEASLNINLGRSDILFCEKALNWERFDKESDIVVRFLTPELRNFVLHHRVRIERFFGGDIKICEELCLERVMVLKYAIKKFGRRKVCIKNSGIHVNVDGEDYRLLTLIDLQKLLRKNIIKVETIPEEVEEDTIN